MFPLIARQELHSYVVKGTDSSHSMYVSYDSYSPYKLQFQIYPRRYMTCDVLICLKNTAKTISQKREEKKSKARGGSDLLTLQVENENVL